MPNSFIAKTICEKVLGGYEVISENE
jgi:hypothetical protein